MRCSICKKEDVALVLPTGGPDYYCLPCLTKHQPKLAREMAKWFEENVPKCGLTLYQ